MTDRNFGIDESDSAVRILGRGWLWAIAPAALLVTGFFLAPAVSSAGAGIFGHRTHAGFGSGDRSPEEARERAEHVTGWVLAMVDGTDAQQEQVMAVVSRALQEIEPVAAQHRVNREAWLQALAADSVDRALLEELRQRELSLAAEASAGLVESLAQVADLLSPEQRVKLVKLAAHFPGHSR